MPKSRVGGGLLWLVGSAAGILAAPRTAIPLGPIGRIDNIAAGSEVNYHRGGSDAKARILRSKTCETNTCELFENDVLDILTGQATFSIRPAEGKWTCGPQNNVEIHATGSTCKASKETIAYLGSPVGSDNMADWTARYRPEDMDPKSVSALMMGGLIFEKAGRYAEAREQYRRAQRILPRSGWIQHEMDRMASLDQQTRDGPRPAPRRFAVVIGVSEYLWHPALQLRGAAADASWFAAYLSSPKGGFPQAGGEIIQLTDERATVAAIRRSLRDVLRIRARPGDTVLIYITGHAVQRAQEAFLVGYDSRLEEPRTLYPLDELRQMSQDAGRFGARVTLFTDVCHAGALQKLKRNGATVVPPALDGKYFAEQNVWGIAASAVNELSAELPVEGHVGHLHGAFTRYLIEALHSSAERISNAAVWSYVQDGMSKDMRLHNQHPLQIGGGVQPFYISEAGSQPLVSHAGENAPQGLERFLAGQPGAEWTRLKDASGADAGEQRYRLSVRLESAGAALLNEYLSGEEIPQSASDFQVGAEIYSVLREIAASGKVIQDTPLIEARRCFFEAMALLRAGKTATTPQAVALLNEAQQWDETAGYIYNALGQAYAQAGDMAAASAAFQDAILLNPDWPYARHNLAVIHEVQAQDDRAAKLYQEAMEHALSMGRPPASTYYSLGRLLHARNDLSSARQYYESAQQAFRSLTLMYEKLASRCQGDGCSTYARITRGFRAGEAQAWNALGVLEHDDHHDVRAIKDFERGRDLLADTSDEDALVKSNIRFNLIKLRSLKSKTGEGQRIADLQALIETDKNYIPATFELALLHQRQNPGGKDAENEFLRVSELQPEAAQGWQGLVEVLLAQRRATEAQETLQRAMQQLDQESFRELRRAFDAAAARSGP